MVPWMKRKLVMDKTQVSTSAKISDKEALEVEFSLWNTDCDSSTLFYNLPKEVLGQIKSALNFVTENGLCVENIQQEDVRLPRFARDIKDLRKRLDFGDGFFVIRGLGFAEYSEAEIEIIAWTLCNYLGWPIRQGITNDRRFFTVTDRGSLNTDPTRIGASPQRSPKHSDNGCLEPRPPCYIGLFCYKAASDGGDSTIISARAVHETISKERPDLLPYLFETYHFRSPQAHVWPSRGPTVQKPILEFVHGKLHIHYARVMIEPGMKMAGTPLTKKQTAALDYLDEVLERPSLNFCYVLKAGELLVLNNLEFLHGREAFPAGTSGGRSLKRFWMWRRHIGPGTDPAALDLEELG
jgi:hypothetical protein